MRVVVDASVVVAALMADGTVRDTLLSSSDHDFVAPSYIREEVTRNLPRVAHRARLDPVTVRALVEDVLEAIDLVPPAFYAQFSVKAGEIVRRAGARGDVEYVALALLLDAPVWTLDADFRRIPGLAVLSPRDVAGL